VSHHHIHTDYLDAAGLKQLAAVCQAVTTEFENVPAEALAQLAATLPVSPAASAVAVAQEVVQGFVRQGPTEAELQAAKSNLVGGFALRIDSNAKLLENISNIAWNNLPLDYLDTWTAQLEKISAADIKAAFSRKLQPERMVTVVLGAGQ
jgi:predicted Zn-dependent peptidase